MKIKDLKNLCDRITTVLQGKGDIEQELQTIRLIFVNEIKRKQDKKNNKLIEPIKTQSELKVIKQSPPGVVCKYGGNFTGVSITPVYGAKIEKNEK